MFESDEATVPQDDETVISRERFTGLSEEMMQELRKTHELTRRMTPRLLIDVTSMIKPHCNCSGPLFFLKWLCYTYFVSFTIQSL